MTTHLRTCPCGATELIRYGVGTECICCPLHPDKFYKYKIGDKVLCGPPVFFHTEVFKIVDFDTADEGRPAYRLRLLEPSIHVEHEGLYVDDSVPCEDYSFYVYETSIEGLYDTP